jgi:hypothetical protein
VAIQGFQVAVLHGNSFIALALISISHVLSRNRPDSLIKKPSADFAAKTISM